MREITLLNEALLGKDIAEARNIAFEMGYRIVSKEQEPGDNNILITNDYDPSRVNVTTYAGSIILINGIG